MGDESGKSASHQLPRMGHVNCGYEPESNADAPLEVFSHYGRYGRNPRLAFPAIPAAMF